MRPLKLELMENKFGKEDSNGLRVTLERSVVAQFLNGKQCLQEQKLILITPVTKLKLNSHVLLMKHQIMNHLV